MPDPIAPYIPACPIPSASNESGAQATADVHADANVGLPANSHASANAGVGANADANADAGPDAQTNTGWHRLPAELVAHVGSFLPWQALEALRLTHKRTHQALASCTVTARVGWRIACVSSLSTLRYTVRALRDPLLSDANRANALCALAERLPRLDGGMVAAARDVLLEGIARLPAPLRARPVVGVMHGLARCEELVCHPRGALPLLLAVEHLPPAQRAEPLIACLRIASLTQDAMPDVDEWIDEALQLPMPDRGAVLAQILRRFPFVRATRADERVQQFLQARARLQTPDGEPSWSEQAAVLAGLADTLDVQWEAGYVRDEPAAHRLWCDLLEAARALPPGPALDVMVALAGPGSQRLSDSAAQRWPLLWNAGQRFAADPARWTRWLGALAAHHGWAEPPDAWDRLFDAAATLPPDGQGPVLAMLARGVAVPVEAADREARWHALHERIVAVPAASRAGPLAELADALLTDEADMEDPRWQRLLDALRPLPAASQVKVLLACIEIGNVERFWAPCHRIIMTRLPMEERAGVLTQLADWIAQLAPHAQRAPAWWDIARSVPALPPAQRHAPWQMLLRRVHRVFEFDPEGHRRAWDTLAELLAGQPPVARQQCLLGATWNADAGRCEWVLMQVRDLPAALQGEVLARLARCAGAQGPMAWHASERVTAWMELVRAVRELPTHYRGAPLPSLARLLGELPHGIRLAARSHFVALLRGVAPDDIPAGFHPLAPFAESALVRRVLKRPRYPVAMRAIAPKRERIDETWP
ncbi:hypothetical protein K7G19_15800 [Cupriavidus sp. DB3]|uniref:hypothetical protein n=1 Tax=Cupriavidus sp. DB3 TaxID=2873259 RepID=UPI001CF370CC|nr:hypothetical protein [Cupriavidus sp. DB3]MCA7085060.1 hypothetical protein [Cupriavidus sp. DB3]